MEKRENHYWGYLSTEEITATERFLEDGYIITDVEDMNSLAEIRAKVIALVADCIGEKIGPDRDVLNVLHEFIDVENLNDVRVDLIQKINNDQWLVERYFKLVRLTLELLVGNELAMQRQVNLSIQLPGDASSLLPVHADVWSGDSPFEVVVWLPLVDCYGTKSMFLLPPVYANTFHQQFSQYEGKSSEHLYRAIESDLVWIDIPYGKVLVFNQNLPHGNRVNEEAETRWSMNCRFKSIYSPYGDKKLGEFFVPVTIRAASRVGMAYKFPGEK